MAPLMDIFAGGEEVVQFAPVGPEDVAAAEQETDYVNHVFMQHNPGFLVLYSFIKDALLSKVGVVSLEFGGIEGAGYDPRPGLWFNAVAWSTLSPSLACLAAQAPPFVLCHADAGAAEAGRVHGHRRILLRVSLPPALPCDLPPEGRGTPRPTLAEATLGVVGVSSR